MALPTIHAFSVDNLTTLRGTTSVNGLTGSVDNESIELIGYYTDNDGGGGTFYWDSSSTATEVLGMIIRPYIGGSQVATGRWIRLYDGFVDVKWFGCKGDNITNDTANFQRALNFVAAQLPHKVDLYISQGWYVVYPPQAPSKDCLLLNMSSVATVNIYGDGPLLSYIRYEPNGDSTYDYNIFRIQGYYASLFEISDFTIRKNDNQSEKWGRGLVLDHLQFVSVNNFTAESLDHGIWMQDVLSSSFRNVYCGWGNVGLHATRSTTHYKTANLLNFLSCNFHSNSKLGVDLTGSFGFHSVTFTSCGIEGNGTQSIATAGGIHADFVGVDGTNGLNLYGCYFEGNKGGFDVKLTCSGLPGTHIFQGNSFNRKSDLECTINNILVDGNGQSPQPEFGFSKTKLHFQGNGFLNGVGYTPSASQKNIEILNSNPDYWQYDIVEEGNGFREKLEAPSFNKRTPQISEYTRVKAFGTIKASDEGTTIENDYNILTFNKLGTGWYRIDFANPLTRLPVITVTPVDTSTVIASTSFVTANSFQILVVTPAGTAADRSCSFIAF